MKKNIFCIICCWFFLSCNTQGKSQQRTSMGVVRTFFETFFDNTFPSFSDSSLIWYKDSTAIMQISTVRYEAKNGGPAVRKDTIMHYLYIDLPTMSFYQYGTFTDTASLQRSYSQPDSLYIDGGWNFYYDKNVVMLNKPESISDTIIDKVHYKRVKFTTLEKEARGSYSLGYIRCDKGPSMFSKEKLYTDSLNCLMDKIESYKKDTQKKEIATSIVFLSDTLTKKEIEVFDAWEQYAKRHPPKERKLK